MWLKLMYICLHVNTRYACPILMEIEFSQQIFEKYSNTKFQESPFSGSPDECGHTEDWRTWRSYQSLLAIVRTRLDISNVKVSALTWRMKKFYPVMRCFVFNIFMTMEEVLVYVVAVTYGHYSDTKKIVLCKYHLCRRPVQSAEAGRWSSREAGT